MATFKKIATTGLTAASNTSLTSAFHVPGEFSHFAIEIPTTTAWCGTTTCNIGVLVSDSSTGTFREVSWSASPGTTTTGVEAVAWRSGLDPSSKMVVCEALMFSPGWAKLKFISTATATTNFVVWGRRFD